MAFKFIKADIVEYFCINTGFKIKIQLLKLLLCLSVTLECHDIN